jgi:signal peptidase I
VNTFEQMILAGEESLKSSQDNIWIFENQHKLTNVKNPVFQKEIEKYYYYMQNKNTPISFFKTSSTSMCKTIVKGQSVLSINDSSYIPKRNDMLAYYLPNQVETSVPILKNDGTVVFVKKSPQKIKVVRRCIAIGGDEIFIKNKNLFLHPHEGNAFIKKHFKSNIIIKIDNKLWVKNPYMEYNKGITHDNNITRNTTSKNFGRFDFNITKIPENNFFALGDNREHSYDGRHYGSIPTKNIIGKVILLKFKSNLKNLFGVQMNKNDHCIPPPNLNLNYNFLK